MSPDTNVKLASIQWDVELGQVSANLDKARTLIKQAADEGTRLAVLPEMWATSFMAEAATEAASAVKDAEAEIQDLSKRHHIILVGSNYEYREDGKIYNRARLFEEGEVRGEYRKIHLFSPLGEDRHFEPGREACVVDTSLGRVAVAICYDLRFPELCRALYLDDATILCLPSMWPEARALHWRVLARARAIENQWFVIATNRCGFEISAATGQEVQFPGNSLIVDPTGEIRSKGNGEESVVSAEVDLKEVAIVRRAIPVSKDRREDVYEHLSVKPTRQLD
jgi:predicted amidohydrolase